MPLPFRVRLQQRRLPEPVRKNAPVVAQHLGDTVSVPHSPERDETGFRHHTWTNNWESDGSSTCGVCGVTLEPNLIHADRGGMKYHYRDVYGTRFSSFKPLPCPTFAGNMVETMMETKEKVRVMDGRVESIEDRLTRLEIENEALREQQPIDANDILDALRMLVAQVRESVGPKQLEDHSLIIDIGDFEIVERVPELVPVRDLEEDVE